MEAFGFNILNLPDLNDKVAKGLLFQDGRVFPDLPMIETSLKAGHACIREEHLVAGSNFEI